MPRRIVERNVQTTRRAPAKSRRRECPSAAVLALGIITGMELAECVSRWLAKPVRLLRQVFNSEHAEVWQASSGACLLAVHVSPTWRPTSQLTWCHAVARYANQPRPRCRHTVGIKGFDIYPMEGPIGVGLPLGPGHHGQPGRPHAGPSRRSAASRGTCRPPGLA